MEKSSLTQSTQHQVDTPGFYSSVNAMEKSSLTQSTQSHVERPGFNSSVNAMEKSSFTQSTESQVESPGFYSEKYFMENHYEKTSDSGEPIELHTYMLLISMFYLFLFLRSRRHEPSVHPEFRRLQRKNQAFLG
jgi:hypothetical protein